MGEEWDKIWQNELERLNSNSKWVFNDNLSKEIYLTLKREIGDIKGKKILEAGSGSGRISLKLALDGAHVYLLDYSDKALEVSKKYFERYNCEGEFIKADLTKKLPFKDDFFDIVWNGGVMEHFDLQEQISISREIFRIAKEFHTFNPYTKSFFYRLGKWTAEMTKNWPYGVEHPVTTMKNIFERSGFILQREYSVAHVISLDFLVFLKGGNDVAQGIKIYLENLNEEERKETLEQLGGYLLYSKGLKN
ncbi:class I SAM-dependent methyltransferase [Maledivibacter halophilus]|uniref:Ubiquinone/menaquinone biosynthesis C-methylase UbiE n=1 Tax=Maledivibacter halophilus TaxID=36842 RepID=A0A1T5M7H6_9FIRM|nr:class I SAM-dependent methyltransferase [Maledivibacter halophilus]SKC84197.1 Ubiquinone/menaquinone biosynthesis C-methylase UbiE [Maledivibacter halophilus]